ncbi:MAG: DUF433 domain-containing protein [Deltaproteobacteria bacterium]|nr:DUF433 domain-containing protein [Deltaproteobacteria bacterium]
MSCGLSLVLAVPCPSAKLKFSAAAEHYLFVQTGRDLTLTEAAYLASACLAAESAQQLTPGYSSLLATALRFDPGEGPVTVRSIRNAIDEGVVRSWTKETIVVDDNAVFYLAGIKLITAAGELTPQAKATLYSAFKSGSTSVSLAPHLSFAVGAFVAACRMLLDRYRTQISEWIVSNPKTMGGLPCIKGTRIPVYTVLGRIEEGETLDEIAADFDHVPREALEAALTYARTHPRRGRPKQFR